MILVTKLRSVWKCYPRYGGSIMALLVEVTILLSLLLLFIGRLKPICSNHLSYSNSSPSYLIFGDFKRMGTGLSFEGFLYLNILEYFCNYAVEICAVFEIFCWSKNGK